MKRYIVTYSVTRTECYEVDAESEDEAMEVGFEEGEEVDNSGDTTDVTPVSAELKTCPPPNS